MLRRPRMTRTENKVTTSVSNSQTTPVFATSSSSSSSSAAAATKATQIVDVLCSLRHHTRCHTTSRFFIEDILRPDFGVINSTWRPNNYATVCNSLSTDRQHSTSSAASASSRSPTLTTRNCGPTAQPTTTTWTAVCATARAGSIQHKSATGNCDNEPLNVDTLPTWIFSTRYSDRPSSGRQTCFSVARVGLPRYRR